jgi:hypothetical protein
MGQHSAIFIKINCVLSCVFDWEVCIFVVLKYDFIFLLSFFSEKNLCYDNEYLDIDLIAEYLQNDKT